MASPTIDDKIYLIIGGLTIHFPGAQVYRRLEKNLILLKMPWFEESQSGGTVAKDLLRVKEFFTLDGTWMDDSDGEYDGLTAFARYLVITNIAKRKRIKVYLVRSGRSYSCAIKSFSSEKHGGMGTDMIYKLEMVRVDEAEV